MCADSGKGSVYVEKEGLTLLVPHVDGSHGDVICGVLNVHNFSSNWIALRFGRSTPPASP